MDFLTRLLRPQPAGPQALTAQDVSTMILGSGTSGMSLAGVPVNADTALRISAVWACVRLISNSLASTPLIVYRKRADGGRDRAVMHPLYSLLHDQPNASMTAHEFKRLLTVHALLEGNGYARMVPGPRGPVDRLIPIHPSRVEVEQIADDRLRYVVTQNDGQKSVLLDDEMFHLRGLSWDGLTGVSVLQYGRQSMGLALATEEHGARLFKQGTMLSGILTYPTTLTPKAAKAIRQDWNVQHAGLDNAHSVAVFGDGITYTPTGMTNEDAQFLATREFQIADIARWFGVDLALIQENSKATSWGTGIEQLINATILFTLMPWGDLWAQSIKRDMIVATDRYYAEYLFDALVRADIAAKNQAYQTGVAGGWLSRNEVRQMENRNPVRGLDGYDRPLNMEDLTSPPAASPRRAGDDGSAGHYRRLLAEAAERVVRKEQRALSAAAKRAESTEEWAAAVAEFYQDHGAYVAESLAMPSASAELYATTNQLTLLERGPEAVTSWLPERAGQLAELAGRAGCSEQS